MATQSAIERVGQAVHGPALRELPSAERRYLEVMAQTDGPARTGQIAQMLGLRPNHAGNLRLSLIRRGLIYDAGYGAVDFALPYLREHLQTLTAHHAQLPSAIRAAYPSPARIVQDSRAFQAAARKGPQSPPQFER